MMWGEYNTSKNRQNVNSPEFRLKTWVGIRFLRSLLVDMKLSMHHQIEFSVL